MKICLLFLCMLVLCNCCSERLVGGPYYYLSWSGYSIPFRPAKRVSEAEAKAYGCYIVAYFDNSGNIVSFTKYINERMEFQDNYEYKDGKPFKRIGTDRDGRVTVQYFDSDGNLIKSED